MKNIIIPALAAIALAGSANAQDTGGWTVEHSPSAMEPSRSTAVAVLPSTNSVRSGLGLDDRARLFVRCNGSGKIEFYLGWPAYIGRGIQDIDVKWDDLQIDSESWETGQSGTTMGWWNTRRSAPYVEALQNHQRVVVALEAFRGTAQEAVFDLAGADKAIGEMKATCGIT